MLVLRMLYLNKYVETLPLFSFTCLLNHKDDVSRHTVKSEWLNQPKKKVALDATRRTN